MLPQVNTWEAGFFLDHLLYDFRANLPPSFTTGRRFPRDFRAKAVCSWTHEEGINFARIMWRWLLQQFYTRIDGTGSGSEEDLQLLDAVSGAWTKLEGWLLPLMERTGCPLTPDELSVKTFEYALYLRDAHIGGLRAFPFGRFTCTLQTLMHLHCYVLWWGNLRDHQCFCYERVASELTQLLAGWNGRGGCGDYLARKLMLRQVSEQHITKRFARSASRF